jgi:protein O-GlcNAc transferase
MSSEFTQTALALYRAGRLGEADALCRKALAADPRDPWPLYLLGRITCERGQPDVGAGLLRRAIDLAPSEAEFYPPLADACRALRQYDQALAAGRRAVELDGRSQDALTALALVLLDGNRPGGAAELMARAVRLAPSDARAWYHAGLSLLAAGEAARAADCFGRSNALAPNFASRLNRLFAMIYCPEFPPEQVADEHVRWAEHYLDAHTARAPPHDNDPSPNRRLRVGYVSGQFRSHGHALFIEPFLARHDPAAFEVYCYSQGRIPAGDPVAGRLYRAAAGWRDVTDLDDDRAAAVIRADRIDVLVDLNGLSDGNRMFVFARRPAPVQVTYLGYPNTTGMRAIDYRITDGVADPPGQTDSLHRERLVRLDSCFLCFQPPDDAPAATPPPARAAGHVTFGSFNMLPKVTPGVIELWSKVLAAVPGSRIVLKAKGTGDPIVCRRLTEAFAARGVAPERVSLLPPEASTAAHLARYAEVDVALDTFPYHGTTTTCEAMWMGVPTVTLAGRTHVSRVGLSLLSSVGLSDLVADSPEQYVRLAAALAADTPRLADLRPTLRDRMRRSPLMDAPGHTRRLEQAYRRMWETWVAVR